MTQHDQLCRGLRALGHRLDPNARTARYSVFTDAQRPGGHWYVGKAGALRAGATVTGSHSCSSIIRRRVMEAGV